MTIINWPRGMHDPYPDPPSTWDKEKIAKTAENVLLGQTCHFCRIQLDCPQRNNECGACHLFVEALSFSVTVDGVEIKGRCLSATDFKVVGDRIEGTIPYVQDEQD